MADSYILVQCNPVLVDPRELETIVAVSLKHVFGVLDATTAEVLETRDEVALIKCASSSVPNLRAALTLYTLPPYLQDQGRKFQFDVLEIRERLSDIQWDSS